MRERGYVCEATNCAINGVLKRRAPRPHDTETLCKTNHPHLIPGTLGFLLFDLRRGREERGALGADLFLQKDVLPTWEYTRAFRILYGLGPGNGEWERINEESVRYACTLYN
jgi:hypothetical protein